MTVINLGIIGGGQLGSMLATAAKKLNIKTTVYCDDKNAPAQNFCDDFIFGNYQDSEKIKEFTDKINLVTFEFENIPFETLKKINEKSRSNSNWKWYRRIMLRRLASKSWQKSLNS